MKFADFRAGQVITAGPHVVSEQDIVAFASQWDPQWFHTDPEAAAQGPFEGLIASGWHTCCIAMRLVADAALAGSESYASPGLAGLKWPNPVRPDDRLQLTATVIEARLSSRGLGILRWRWQLHNQNGQEVLDLEATSLFKP
ncbi:MAG: MaoC family dehydratase [Nevskiaceae bacterium]|nr:MAG: MaoC family dehydratase [Nevskiaceae bacterium]